MMGTSAGNGGTPFLKLNGNGCRMPSVSRQPRSAMENNLGPQRPQDHKGPRPTPEVLDARLRKSIDVKKPLGALLNRAMPSKTAPSASA